MGFVKQMTARAATKVSGAFAGDNLCSTFRAFCHMQTMQPCKPMLI